jgi:hypothetical protein
VAVVAAEEEHQITGLALVVVVEVAAAAAELELL